MRHERRCEIDGKFRRRQTILSDTFVLYIKLCSKYLMLNIIIENSLKVNKVYLFVFGLERDRVSAEELEVADEVEIETSLEIEERQEHEELTDVTLTKKEEIKWHRRPFTTITDTSFEIPPVGETYPLSPYKYFKQFIPDGIFDIYATQSGTLGLKPTSTAEIRILVE